MVENAFLNALVLPGGYLLLRRLRLPRGLALAYASGVALLAPVVFYSQFALSDTVLPVLVLLWVLTLHGLVTPGPARRRLWYGLGLGLVAGATMAVHDRGGVIVAITGAALLLTLLCRWAPWRAVLVAGAGLGVSVLGAELLQRYLRARFDVAASTVGESVLDGITDPELIGRTLTRTAGQIWYFVISSWGLAGLGVVCCAALVLRRRSTPAERLVSLALLAALFGIALAASAGLPEDHRIDDYVYARYVSLLLPALSLIGLAALHRLSRRGVLWAAAGAVALTLACGGAVLLSVRQELATEAFVLWGLPDASLLADDWDSFHLVDSTVTALAIFAVLLATVVFRRYSWLLAALLVAGAVFATTVVTLEVTRPWSQAREWTATGFARTAGIGRTDQLAMDRQLNWDVLMVQPFEVYWGRTWTLDLHGSLPPADATVAALPLYGGQAPEATWPQAPAGWYLSAVDQVHGYTVWRRR
ncbi:hypothetical protein ACFQ0T_24635 [Kitasatospora gansuensis]